MTGLAPGCLAPTTRTRISVFSPLTWWTCRACSETELIERSDREAAKNWILSDPLVESNTFVDLRFAAIHPKQVKAGRGEWSFEFQFYPHAIGMKLLTWMRLTPRSLALAGAEMKAIIGDGSGPFRAAEDLAVFIRETAVVSSLLGTADRRERWFQDYFTSGLFLEDLADSIYAMLRYSRELRAGKDHSISRLRK